MLGGKLGERDEGTCSDNLRYRKEANDWLKLRSLLNRPQRERLPCLKVGIFMIGKIKPTVAIRAEVRLFLPEGSAQGLTER